MQFKAFTTKKEEEKNRDSIFFTANTNKLKNKRINIVPKVLLINYKLCCII